MRLFTCERCSSVLFFENDLCERCGSALGYDPAAGSLAVLVPDEEEGEGPSAVWTRLQPAPGAERRFRRCKNTLDYRSCNWLVPAGDPSEYCRSCRLSEVIPNLQSSSREQHWRRIEMAKRRLLYTLYMLRLPVESALDVGTGGLAFRFMQDTPQGKVITGHSNGVITLNVDEADSGFRENTREKLGEAYRTVLGHLRHEIGHYYWDRLVRDSSWLEPFRDLFGDERADYQKAVQRHYEHGAPENYREAFISAYATMHPWEDWAETWAHYLHMIDTLETASVRGVVVRKFEPDGPGQRAASQAVDFDDFDSLIHTWYPLTLTLNDLSRSMGTPDMYPFALSDSSEGKLRMVHDVIQDARCADETAAEGPAEA